MFTATDPAGDAPKVDMVTGSGRGGSSWSGVRRLRAGSVARSAHSMLEDSSRFSPAWCSQKICDVQVEARQGVEMEWCGHELQIGQA